MLYEDPEDSAIRLELQHIEQALQAMTSAYAEAQNKVADFNRDYHLHLGNLLVRILSLKEDIAAQQLSNSLSYYRTSYQALLFIHRQVTDKKANLAELDERLNQIDFMADAYTDALGEYQEVKAEVDKLEAEREAQRFASLKAFEQVKTEGVYQAFEEAKEEADAFEQESEEIKQSVVAHLSPEEKTELKALYRKACKICHPDIVSDELKEHAHEFMVEINQAYASQDLDRLNAVFSRIETGEAFSSSSKTLSGKSALLAKLQELKDKLAKVESDLAEYENSSEYQAILAIGDDWSSYFDEQKAELKTLEAHLEQELADLIQMHTDIDDNFYQTDELAGFDANKGFWRQGHWQDGVWVRGAWVTPEPA